MAWLSARTGEGLAELSDAVQALFPQGTPGEEGAVLTNARQAEAAGRPCLPAWSARGGLDAGVTPDAVLTDVEGRGGPGSSPAEHSGGCGGAHLRPVLCGKVKNYGALVAQLEKDSGPPDLVEKVGGQSKCFRAVFRCGTSGQVAQDGEHAGGPSAT